MKKIRIKISDERNRAHSIRTIIERDETTGEKSVRKEAVYPEGKKHIQRMLYFREILAGAYPDVKICPVRAEGEDAIRFAFIEGRSLEDFYREACGRKDREEFERFLLLHRGFILGGKDNGCLFAPTARFRRIFGEAAWEEGVDGLRVANFDATAGNIIMQEMQPVFIDYEWVCDFVIPADLAVYHCVRDSYLHLEKLEAFYPLADAMQFLGVKTPVGQLETAYRKFHESVILDDAGASFALAKSIFLKGEQNFSSYREDMEKQIAELNASLSFAEQRWQEASQANFMLSQEVQAARREAESERENHRIHAAQLEAAVQGQVGEAEKWRISYETVVNSRTWRWADRIKRILGRK